MVKAGEVFHLRISPRDVVGCVRVCERAGMVLPGASLAQHVALALRILLESARQTEAIPAEENAFDAYAQIKERFKFPQARKLDAFRVLAREEIAAEVADTPLNMGQAAIALTSNAAARQRKQVRMDELSFKKRTDPMNWSEEEEQELVRLADELIVNS